MLQGVPLGLGPVRSIRCLVPGKPGMAHLGLQVANRGLCLDQRALGTLARVPLGPQRGLRLFDPVRRWRPNRCRPVVRTGVAALLAPDNHHRHLAIANEPTLVTVR